MKIIEKYKKLNENDLNYSESMDRVFTKLVLDDYDWMCYQFQAIFPIKEGRLVLEMEYFGFITSDVKISLIKGSENEEESYRIDSDIFKEFMKKYLDAHAKHWDKEYAFSGEYLAIGFYNEIIPKLT